MKSFPKFALAVMAALFVSSDASAQSRAQYESMVASHAAANNVPEALVHRVIVRESKYHPGLVGRGGTIGLMQIKLPTARGLGYTGDAAGLRDPYTIEEAYEVADAIDRSDMAALADELGDLQLQVVFHACMAEEAGLFALDDVMNGISDKLERRHPHIFGNAAEGGHHLWEIIKAEERAGHADQSALAGIALALPALERAAKLQKRAARTGFDWPDIEGPKAKIREELDEIAAAPPEELEEEVGDLLFAAVNFARHLKIDPEEALRKANRKFEKRFRVIEAAPGFADMNLDQMEELWTAAKKS